MADAAEVFAGITRRPGTRYTALVPNLAGLARAIDARVDEVAIFAAASESFSRRNINQSIDESLATYRGVCDARSAPRACRCAPTSRRRSAVRSKGRSQPSAVADVVGRADRHGRVRGRGQRHDRHRASRPGADRRRRGRRARAARPHRAALPRHPRHGARQRAGRAAARCRRRSIPPPAASAAAPTRRARPATSRPRICSTCSTGSASKPASASTGPGGVALHRRQARSSRSRHGTPRHCKRR